MHGEQKKSLCPMRREGKQWQKSKSRIMKVLTAHFADLRDSVREAEY